MKREINTNVKAIGLMVRDLRCEYALDLSEEDFIKEIEKRNNIDIHFSLGSSPRRAMSDLVSSNTIMKTLPSSLDTTAAMAWISEIMAHEA